MNWDQFLESFLKYRKKGQSVKHVPSLFQKYRTIERNSEKMYINAKITSLIYKIMTPSHEGNYYDLYVKIFYKKKICRNSLYKDFFSNFLFKENIVN